MYSIKTTADGARWLIRGDDDFIASFTDETTQEEIDNILAKLNETLPMARAIHNLSTAPHWTSRRRWDIEKYASKLVKILEKDQQQ